LAQIVEQSGERMAVLVAQFLESVVGNAAFNRGRCHGHSANFANLPQLIRKLTLEFRQDSSGQQTVGGELQASLAAF
jgi:hypothetical protein